MAMIPKTVGELRKYLETLDDDMPILFFDENDGYVWYLSIEPDTLHITGDTYQSVAVFSLFEMYDPWAKRYVDLKDSKGA